MIRKLHFLSLVNLPKKILDSQTIYRAGHEIASHSYSHIVTPNLEPEEFRKDIRKSKDILRNIIGEDIIGYRAPKWSVNEKQFGRYKFSRRRV